MSSKIGKGVSEGQWGEGGLGERGGPVGAGGCTPPPGNKKITHFCHIPLKKNATSTHVNGGGEQFCWCGQFLQSLNFLELHVLKISNYSILQNPIEDPSHEYIHGRITQQNLEKLNPKIAPNPRTMHNMKGWWGGGGVAFQVPSCGTHKERHTSRIDVEKDASTTLQQQEWCLHWYVFG